MSFTQDEFFLQLSWMPRINGVTPVTPGFYVRADYANEGYAMGIVKGSWSDDGGGNGSLVSKSFLVDLTSILYEHGLLEPHFHAEKGAALGRNLGQFAEEHQREALDRKRSRLEALRAEVAELEAQFRAQEPKKCACGRYDSCSVPGGGFDCPNYDDD